MKVKYIFWCLCLLSTFFTRLNAQSNPIPFELKEGNYTFESWNSLSATGSFPDHMAFWIHIGNNEPSINSEPDGNWICNYNSTKGSRFVGLNAGGIGIYPDSSIIDSAQCLSGVNYGKVGAIALSLNTEGRQDIAVSWQIKLLLKGNESQQAPEYKAIAQYRTENSGSWKNIASSEFSTLNKSGGDSVNYSLTLPKECNNIPFVQVRWKIFLHQINNGGERPALGIDQINIESAVFSDTITSLGVTQTTIPEFASFLEQSSSSISLKIGGRNLKGNVSLQTLAPFEISFSEQGPFQQTLTILPENGSLDSQSVFIRFTPVNLEKNDVPFKIFTINTDTILLNLIGTGYPHLFINEVMASNLKTIKDQSGDYEDWIEIYNPNEFEVNVSNYNASDNPENLTKFKLKSDSILIIPPQGFLLLWASDATTRGANHVNFKLSATEGEYFFLSAANGQLLIDSVSFNQQNADISYGREKDGESEWVLFGNATPNASNNNSQGTDRILSPPIFSRPAGFYQEEFDLTLKTNDPGTTIIYTLDGSDPDINNLNGSTYFFKIEYPRNPGMEEGPFIEAENLYKTNIYTNPIKIKNISSEPDRITRRGTMVELFPFTKFPKNPVKKGIVVRAQCVKEGQLPSRVVTKTYFIDSNRVYSDKLPVLSIALQEDYLFDYNKGIYTPGVDFDNWRRNNPLMGMNGGRSANYTRRGNEWEYTGNIEFFDDTIPSFNQSVGIRIHGNWSRSARVKGLRIYARDDYGNSEIFYPIFPDVTYYNFKRLLLRNSGSDWIRTYYRDGMNHELIKHLNVSVQSYRPSALFINGEYWGIINIREYQDEDYLKAKFDVDPNKIDLLGPNLSIIAGDRNHYNNLLNYVRTNGAYTERDYEYLNTQMDIENYIEYNITRIFSRITDWPGNNIKFWRLKTSTYEPDAPYGNDGRWRWLFYDADSGFGYEGGIESYKHNTLVWATDSLLYGNPAATFLLRNMVRNKRFETEFVTRFADLLNTAFRPERVSEYVLNTKARIEEEMVKHIQRWGDPVNMYQWNNSSNIMVKFGLERAPYVRNHIREFFNYPGQYDLNLDVSDLSHGYIKVNTVNINPKTPGVDSIPYPWTGIYFKTVPVRLEAKEYNGFLFNRWELKDSISYYPIITIDPNSDFTAKAYFVIDTNYQYVPKPHILANCNFEFSSWSPSAPKETYPDNMIFPYMNYEDPRLNSEIDSFTTGSYNLISKTRINGLNENGVAFLNSGSGNPGYPEVRLGGAIVGLNTENVKEATLKWTGGTVQANSLVYHIRLQYRIGDEGEFKNLLDRNGIPVEYKRNDTSGHFKIFDEIQLPDQLMGQKYVQLFWRYYFTGLKLDEKTNARDQLRIDDIVIRQGFIDSIYTSGEYLTTIQANQNGVSFTWFKCENDSLKEIPSDNTSQLDINKPGFYAVAIQYKNCSDTSECFYAFVKDQLTFKSNITATIFPNPVKDKLTVSLGNEEDGFTATIFDMQGRTMGQYYSGRNNQLVINTTGLSSGVYVLVLKTQSGESSYQKFVRQ